MATRLIIVLCVLGLLGVARSDQKSCIKGKYDQSLGQPFTTCYDTKQSLPIPRMKQCWTDIMKTENVVKTASNGQMTVDRNNFGEFARLNNNDVATSMKKCHNRTAANDDMWKEAARASQCVFDGLKQKCK